MSPPSAGGSRSQVSSFSSRDAGLLSEWERCRLERQRSHSRGHRCDLRKASIDLIVRRPALRGLSTELNLHQPRDEVIASALPGCATSRRETDYNAFNVSNRRRFFVSNFKESSVIAVRSTLMRAFPDAHSLAVNLATKENKVLQSFSKNFRLGCQAENVEPCDRVHERSTLRYEEFSRWLAR
jgi:hypothetical protein